MALNDTEQSLLMLFSTLLLGLGTVSALMGTLPFPISIGLIIAAAVGGGLKDALGATSTLNPLSGLPDDVQGILVFIAYGLVAVGAVTIPAGHPLLGGALLVLGAVGVGVKEALGAIATETPVKGISNDLQAALVIVSSILISVGAISIPSNSTFGSILAIAGVFGMSIKEFLGSQSATVAATSTPVPSSPA